MDEIEERFRLAPLAQMPTAVWSRSEYTLPYFPEHLERDRVLTSVLTLTYRVFS